MPERMSEDLPDRMPGGRGGEDNSDEILIGSFMGLYYLV